LADADSREVDRNPDDLALLQYTSGSTRAPRGVRITHANLWNNLRQIERCFGHDQTSRGVIWLPPTHDMGLIGGVLQPLYAGFPVWLMSPQAFLKRPRSWLEAISQVQGTTSGGPNFAYDLCVERISADELSGLDLSSWKVAFTGAEPVRSSTLAQFAEKFAPCGFQREAFVPCYGLAEATLMASCAPRGRRPVISNRTLPACTLEAFETTVELVSCGKPVEDLELRIVDPVTGTECEPGVEGEIWVRGPSVSTGYWTEDDGDAELFSDQASEGDTGPFLRTGDLGLLQGDELYVTGRRKAVIILAGKNFSAVDIEFVAGSSHASLSPHRCAAFGVCQGDQESLVVLAEIDRAKLSAIRGEASGTRVEVELASIRDSVRSALSRHLELRAREILIVNPLSLPKTASGKMQRHVCRERYLADQLDLVGGGLR
jgi:acyl-CoA synthetase (AMP-forming)/AMP-acid ligase II